MNQHQIPQQISSYEFRLVGDMTLKQFLKLAVGILAAYIIYNSGLLIIFRLPLAITFLVLGIATAFLPFNDRPLEYWLSAFVRAIYSPTVYIWKKASSPIIYSQIPLSDAINQVIIPDLQGKAARLPSAPPPIASSVPEIISQETKILEVEKPVSPIIESTAELGQVATTKPESFDIQDEKIIEELVKPAGQKVAATSPQFVDIPLPAMPTIPNVVSGLVLSDEGKIVEGAIVEIQDTEGSPIRAMRTNALGQFQTATPLPNGQYLLLVEKDPLSFEAIKIIAANNIMPPLQIVAKKFAVN